MEDKYQPIYSIGEASKKLVVVVPLLRTLEKAGLVLTARTEHGKRLYSQCDLDYIQSILQLAKRKEFSLEDLHRLIGSIRCWEILECEPSIRNNCPHYLKIQKPCWLEGDCPWVEGECPEKGRVEHCRDCPVYKSIHENLLLALFD